jgi:hypothetical protein
MDFPVEVIIDRRVDLFSVLCSQFTYQVPLTKGGGSRVATKSRQIDARFSLGECLGF